MADYIDRDAAIVAVCDGCNENFEDEPCEPSECSIRERLNAIPAADVREVVRGEWIDYTQGRWVYAKCSKCETVHDTKTNYCPNCGAVMREREDG